MNANSLSIIYEEMYGPLDSPGKLKNLTELAGALSGIAGKEPAWTARYLNGIILGHKGFAMTDELRIAIEALGMKRDGANPLQARLVKVDGVWSINGNIQPGDILTGKRTRCPGCLTWFVPHHNLQVYCGKECPGRPRRKPTPRPRSPD